MYEEPKDLPSPRENESQSSFADEATKEADRSTLSQFQAKSGLSKMSLSDVRAVARRSHEDAEFRDNADENSQFKEKHEPPVVDALQMQAADEWDAIEKLQEEFPENRTSGLQLSDSTTLSYEEAIEYFRSVDITEEKKKIVVSSSRGSIFASMFSACFGPPALVENLQEERDMIFAWAQMQFQNENNHHVRLLTTIYMRLTGTPRPCPRYGGHWEDIGFQGNDPSTDLRGVGILGLLQILNLTYSHKQLSHDIYKLAHHEQQHFPMCVVSINLTKIVVECLRDEILNRDCNRKKSVLQMANDLHVALFYDLYITWKRKNYSVRNFGQVLKDLTNKAKTNYGQLIRDYNQSKQQANPKSGTSNEELFTQLES